MYHAYHGNIVSILVNGYYSTRRGESVGIRVIEAGCDCGNLYQKGQFLIVHSLKLDGLVLVSVPAWFATEHTEEALAEPAQEATHDEEGYRNPGPDNNCACETVDVAKK